MKDEKEIHTPRAGVHSLGAILDARMRNIKGKGHFTSAQIAKAMAVQYVLESCYGKPHRDTEINYRAGRIGSTNQNKFIAIKLFTDTVRDKKALKQIESNLESDQTYKKPPTKRFTANNEIIYRLYF